MSWQDPASDYGRSIVKQALEATRGLQRTRHRPHFGAMSTSLLDDLLTDHLDKGYALAAQRRTEQKEQPAAGAAADPAATGRRTQTLLAVGLLLAGFILASGYRSATRQAPDSERARQALVSDVARGTAESNLLQQRAEALSAQLVRERDAALTAGKDGGRAISEVRRLEAAAALVPVRGPGLTIRLADAAAQQQIDPATGGLLTVPADDSGRLRDRDLQSVTNALWASGAEAISINGERISPSTAIRAAGEAILVDLFPITSPYTIEAIGDPDTLLPRFADSVAARRYVSYAGLYGMEFTTKRTNAIELRAATGSEQRHAQPVVTSNPTTTGTPTTGNPAATPSGSAAVGSGAPGTPRETTPSGFTAETTAAPSGPTPAGAVGSDPQSDSTRSLSGGRL